MCHNLSLGHSQFRASETGETFRGTERKNAHINRGKTGVFLAPVSPPYKKGLFQNTPFGVGGSVCR